MRAERWSWASRAGAALYGVCAQPRSWAGWATAALAALLSVPLLAQEAAPAPGGGILSLASLMQLGCVLLLGVLVSQLVMLTLAARWVGIGGGVGKAFVAIFLGGIITVVMLIPIFMIAGNSLNEWAAGIVVQAISVLALCFTVKWLFEADWQRALITVFLALAMTTVVLSLGLVLIYGR